MILTYCLMLVGTISLAISFLAHALSNWLSLQQRAVALKQAKTRVSVLKPLKGLDDSLEQNLESFCGQIGIEYELIIGAADQSDPALIVARKVARRHPHVSIRIVVGEHTTGLNPKLRVLRRLIREARYEAILISDSNVQVPEYYLNSISASLNDPSVGLVSNPIRGVGSASPGSCLENLQLNSYVLHGVLLSNFVAKHACVVGKSMLFRRSALQAIGGFQAFEDILAEDYIMGRAIAEAGWRVVTNSIAINTITSGASMSTVWSRHLRWAQIRRSMGALPYACEVMLCPNIWWGLVAASAAANADVSGPDATRSALVAATLAIGLSLTSEWTAVSKWAGRPLLRPAEVALICLRQHIQLAAWAVAWWVRTVNWRGNLLRIGKGSLLSPVKIPSTVSARLTRQAA